MLGQQQRRASRIPRRNQLHRSRCRLGTHSCGLTDIGAIECWGGLIVRVGSGLSDVDQPGEDAGVHQPGVDVLKAKGVFEGTGCVDGSGGLCLSDPLPRWEMAVWLVRVHDDEEPRTVPDFVDVDSSLWWSAHTGRLAELGVTLGLQNPTVEFLSRWVGQPWTDGGIPSTGFRPSR